MKKRNEIIFVIKCMSGGGAERVISLLSDAAVKKGYEVSLILTHQSKENALLDTINNNITVLSLPDAVAKSHKKNMQARWVMLYSRLLGKISKVFTGKPSNCSLVWKYYGYHYDDIRWLQEYFKQHSQAAVISFLYDANFYSLLAVTKKNRLIISERNDPCQSLASKTTVAFLKSMFRKADGIVFQSPDVEQWYKDHTGVCGKVIFNPVKSDLPVAFQGQREKKIVNFCRISSQKNLVLLLDSFEMFHKDFPEYELYIYGDPVGNAAEDYVDVVENKRQTLACKDAVHLLPSRRDIHSVINHYAMFVSSSDFEGMSNSMLEAMALGLPCVCTDCPAGGARAVIQDGENGLLVPVNDRQALYEAMKRIAQDPDFANQLSQNAVKIRKTQSLESIIEEWMKMING